MHGRGEIELRVTGSEDAGLLARIEAALRGLDPQASVRVDPATGIVHALTTVDTLDAVAALEAAGLDPSAASG